MRNTCRCVGFALRLYLDAIKLQKNMDSLLESERMGTSELRYGKYGPALMRDMFTSRLSEGVGMLEDCGIDLSKVKPQKSFGINGDPFICYPSEIDIEIGGHKLIIPVHFSNQLSSAFPCILGQENFFSKAKIIFERYKWNLDIRLI